MNRLRLINIEELPIGEQQERPLSVRRKRTSNKYVKCGGSTKSKPSSGYQKDVQVTVDSDSPAKCQPSEKGTIIKSPTSKKRVRRSLCQEVSSNEENNFPSASSTNVKSERSLPEYENEHLLKYGSEGSDSDEEETEVPVLIPKAARIFWETPEDEEVYNQDVTTDSTVAAAADDNFATPSSPTPILTASGEDSTSDPESTSSPYFPRDFLDFDWKSFPNPPVPPMVRREPFCSTNCGPTISVSDPYGIFTAIWDRELVELIVKETNLYAEQVVTEKMRTGELSPQSRIVEWKETSVNEIYVYLSIILAMGVVIKSQMQDYWSNSTDIFYTPGFRAHMSLRRFQLLNKCLHFNNNRQMGRSLTHSEAKLFKIEPVITYLNRKFSSLYKLEQNIALDESLLQWKGWLDINQFIPNKAAAVGIKSYEICESQSGYLWRFAIHAHKPTPQTAVSTDPFTAGTSALVLNLIQGLEQSGRTLWMDNFYNSPALARKLKSIGLDCVGTLRTNRKLVPKELSELTKSNMKPGQTAGFTSGDVDVMVWRDQNRVALISTYHGNAVSIVNNVTKPIIVRDYNICMGGVDKKDQMLATYPIERKRTHVWYKKLFRRLLNVSVLNSFIIHKKNSRHRLTHRAFRTTLIKSILEKHSAPTPIEKPNLPSNIFEAKHHYPKEYPFLGTASKNRHRHPCKVCKTRTITYCVGCDKAVCAFKCFARLHS